jgi:cation diffusion facilitator CzcD-associated flavoprotein CzcO
MSRVEQMAPRVPPVGEFDAVVIGAGFAGLYMLYRLRELGLSVRVYEAGDGVGGTWYWNRYPGCRCDCPSIYYSYSFSPELDQEWEWAEKFPSQPEILRYLNHVADRFDLRRDIQFSTRVTAARYDEATGQWIIETDREEQVRATYCITAVGCLSAPNTPNFPGIESFAGRIFHTGRWPHEPVDFTGRRVGVIGTGSTGIQLIPFVAQQAAHLTVFQRTPNYTLPARNAPLPKEELAQVKARYPQIRAAGRYSREGMDLRHLERDRSVLEVTPEERQQTFEQGWALGSYVLMRLYGDLTANLEANRTIADFVRAKIRAIVHDPVTAEKLTPYDHPLGSKRLPIDTDYYETYNRPNVSLVDVRAAPIEAITPKGLCTRDADYELDDLIFATGFDAMTGPLLRIDLRGRGGLTLKEKWAAGPRTYLGLQTVGFPNLFTITGPGSPSVLTNMPAAIEQHVEWIADCIAYLRAHEFTTIEPTLPAEEAWVEHVNELASHTLYPLANSWYLGSNIPGKPRLFMPYVGGLGTYRKKCDEVAANGYEGFCLRGKLELGAL